MNNRVARATLAVIFIALLATPLVLKRLSARRAAERSSADVKTTMARHGFYLQEVSQAAGIRFIHEAPALDPKLEPIMPEVASMGASVSIVDFDRDGWSDIYVTNSGEGSTNALFRNMGDGSFKDVAAKYRGRGDAAQVLEQKVRNGGTGVWGDIPMPPNPAVPDAELHAIVQWVLTSR